MAPGNKPKRRLGRPRGSGRAEDAAVMIGVRINAQERSLYTARANASNMTLSQWIRGVLDTAAKNV